MRYHDDKAKVILGQTLPAGQTCEQDVRSAVNLLMQHKNVAPFISKKLILRLTKSNPEDDYVKRVATVFANSGGDLAQTVKAILLDEEIWEDIKNGKGVKIKEPYLAFTGTLRAIDAQSLKKITRNNVELIDDGFYAGSLYGILGQWVTNSPSVFNFYSDEFVPDVDEFKVRGFVAPELEIITSKYNVNYYNSMSNLLYKQALSYINLSNRPSYRTYDDTYLYIDYQDFIDVFRNNGFGKDLDKGSSDTALREKAVTKALDYISMRLIGDVLPEDQRDIMIDKYTKTNWWPNKGNNSYETMKRYLVERAIRYMILEITHTDNFMVQ
jgi:hypothetical protein